MRMMKLTGAVALLTMAALTACTDETVEINEKNFPDRLFRQFLMEQRYGADGKLTAEELDTIRTMDVSNRSVVALEGIENFRMLEVLDCHKNYLRALDVSHNTELERLVCEDNKIEAIDLRNLTKLRVLGMDNNWLAELDVSRNPELETLSVNNNCLQALDVSRNAKLMHLFCADNRLARLDVSHNPELTYLYCPNNDMSEPDLSENRRLKGVITGFD